MNPLYNSSGQAYFKSDLAWVCLWDTKVSSKKTEGLSSSEFKPYL